MLWHQITYQLESKFLGLMFLMLPHMEFGGVEYHLMTLVPILVDQIIHTQDMKLITIQNDVFNISPGTSIFPNYNKYIS